MLQYISDPFPEVKKDDHFDFSHISTRYNFRRKNLAAITSLSLQDNHFPRSKSIYQLSYQNYSFSFEVGITHFHFACFNWGRDNKKTWIHEYLGVEEEYMDLYGQT